MDTTVQKPYVTKQCLERLELSNKPTVVVTEKLKRQIGYLHKQCGAIEWSGELITSETNTINDLDNWTIKCEDIYLVDIGTSGFTGYEVDKGGFKSADIIELYDAYPGLMDGSQKNHHIHTHHSMDAFFSGTDWSQLEDRGVLSNYLLMLIVNFKGNYVAKVAFKATRNGKSETTLDFANNLDGFAPLVLGGEKSKEVLVVMDCKIEFESTVVPMEIPFVERYTAVKKAIEDAKPVYPGYVNGVYQGYQGKYGSIGGNYNGKDYTGKKWQQGELGLDGDDDYGWGDYGFNNSYNKSQNKEKSIMEMTDAEWEKYVDSKSTPDTRKVLMSKEDAYGVLNSFIEDNYLMTPESPIDNLIKKNNLLKTKKDLESYVADFPLAFEEHFTIMYPQATTWDYIQVLELLEKHLKSFTYNRLIKGIMEELTYMILSETEIALSEQEEDDKVGGVKHVIME